MNEQKRAVQPIDYGCRQKCIPVKRVIVKKINVIPLLLLPTLIVIGNSMYIPLIPFMQESYNLSQSGGAWLLSLFTLAGVLCIPIGQLVAQRITIKKTMQLSCVVVLVGAALSSLEIVRPSLCLVVVGRTLMGAGAGSGTALTYMYTALYVETIEKKRVFGLLEQSNGLAKMISPLLGSLLIYVEWSYAPFILFVIAIVSLCFIPKLKEPKVVEKTKVKRVSVKKTRNDFVRIMSDFSLSLSHLFLLYGLLFYASYHFSFIGMIPAVKGILLGLPFLVMVTTASLSRKITLNKQMTIKVVMMTLLLIASSVFFFVPSSVLLLCFYLCVIGTSAGVALPLASNNLANIENELFRSRIIAGLTMARFIGIATAPLFYGRWMQKEGLVELFGLMFTVLACLLVFLPNFRQIIQRITQ